MSEGSNHLIWTLWLYKLASTSFHMILENQVCLLARKSLGYDLHKRDFRSIDQRLRSKEVNILKWLKNHTTEEARQKKKKIIIHQLHKSAETLDVVCVEFCRFNIASVWSWIQFKAAFLCLLENLNGNITTYFPIEFLVKNV